MPRRLLMLLALVASLAIVGCNSAPAASPLTDPKEILVKSVASLANVKTATIKGGFNGSITAPEVGNFDLSTVKVDVALDIPAKKTRLQVDAPTIMGTNLDIIVADSNVYLKVVGPLAQLAGANTVGKYTKAAADTSGVTGEATDPTKAIEQLRKGLDSLPKAPEKLADENIGGQDCYHVKLALTKEELGEVAEGATMGSVSLDVWTRKNDLRPARISFAMDMGAQGNIGGSFDFTYDGSVSISAPPADQIAP
jgi:hypothetical protein